MPQHDPNDRSNDRSPFEADEESIDDEDFWDRARRTKKEDKKASRRLGRKPTAARKRKAPKGDGVSFGLPPTGGAKGGTDYPVSPRVERARRQLQGLAPEAEPDTPGRGGPRGRFGGDRQGGAPPPPEPPRQPIPMPSVGPSGPSRVPPQGPPGRGPGPAQPPPGPPMTAPTPPVTPGGSGTPPLMSPFLSKSRLAGRRAERSGMTGQTPAVSGRPNPGAPAGPPTMPTPAAPNGPVTPGGSMPRSPVTAARGGRLTGETPAVPPPSARGRSRLSRSSGPADPRTPGGGGLARPGATGNLGAPGNTTTPGNGGPPTPPGRGAPRRSAGAPPAARAGRPDLLVSPPGGTRSGPLPSSRRRPGSDSLSPPAGTPAWDPASTAAGPTVGGSGRTGRPGAGAGTPPAGRGGAAGRRPNVADPGATGPMPRTTYPAAGRSPTTGGGPMLSPNPQAPNAGRLLRPTTGSTPMVGRDTGGNHGPISAELPVVEQGPDPAVGPSPWEPPPNPRSGGRPAPARRGPRSGEVPVLGDDYDDYAPRGAPPRGAQPATSRVDLDRGPDRDFDLDRDRPIPLHEGPRRRTTGTAAGSAGGPGTLAHRRPYDDDLDEDDFDDEYGDGDDFDGSERQGCGRMAVPLLILAVFLCIVLLWAAFWARRQIDPGGDEGKAVQVEVVSGQSTSDIGSTLENANVISSSGVWTWYVRLRGGGDVQAGTYEMHENMSMGDALDALTTGPEPPEARKVTVPEGLTVPELVGRLTSGDGAVRGFTANGVNQALVDPANRSQYLPANQPSVEGTLFPETYNIADDATETELVSKMVDQFDATVGELDITGGAQRLGRTPYEVITIASMIEEEAKFPEERPKVARVIYNRLDQGTPLGIDATSCYEKAHKSGCQLTSADFDKDTPYNTRLNKGLPPTPIASPGRASLDAALHPAAGDWTFYVRNDAEGHHLFTASSSDFDAARQTCEENGWGCG